jgi:hypothetical protein
VERLAPSWLDVTIVLPDPDAELDPGGALDAGDEPRIVRLAGRGERWAVAAGSVDLTLSAAAQAL